MEKIDIKYRIPELKFNKQSNRSWQYSVYYKKTQEQEFQKHPEKYIVDKNGKNSNNFYLSDLSEDSSYIVKLVNDITGDFFQKEFHTAVNITNGESPIYKKVLFPGQGFNWFHPGLNNHMLPANTGGWLFDLTGKFSDTYGGFGPVDAENGKEWVIRSSKNNPEESFNCIRISGNKTLKFNTKHSNEDARIYAQSFISGSVLLGKFYIEKEVQSGMIMQMVDTNETTQKIDSVSFGVSIVGESLFPHIHSVINDSSEIVKFDKAIDKETWYTFEIKFGGAQSGIKIYKCSGSEYSVASQISSPITTLNPFLNVTDYQQTPVSIGKFNSTEDTTAICFCKWYFDPNKNDIEQHKKIIQAHLFLPNLVFEKTVSGGGGVVFPPESYLRLGDQKQNTYKASLDRKDVSVEIILDVTGSSSNNPVSLRFNCYLYQYDDSETFVTKQVKTDNIQDGENQTLNITVPNDFAYSAKLELELILSTGTIDEDLNLKIKEIKVENTSANLNHIFKNNDEILITDNVSGRLVAKAQVTEQGSYYNISIPSLFNGNIQQQTFINPNKWLQRVTDSDVMVTVDPKLPAGEWQVSLKSNKSDKFDTINVDVLTVQQSLQESFDIDFNIDFENSMIKFKELFSGLHSQWGGYNGGCNSNLIYGNSVGKTLIFEQHGDNYEGDVSGVAKPAKNSEFNGYGTVSYYTAPNDPNNGKVRKTRVGSVAVSNKYFGYGEIDTWVKIPKGTYGICMALWLFHYIELYPGDERWQYWIDRGGKPYGGSDPYLVINNEIDIELPSHNVNGEFATWDELRLSYFDQNALDNQYKIGVEGDGTFMYKGVGSPNDKSSWEKVSDTIMKRNYPYYRALKFNNWIGEKSSGNGWAYDQESYNDEEYLALLTDLSQDYADGEFHKYTIKWFKDRSELWIDNKYIRTNKCFVPFNVCRWTIGGWFPSQKEEKYKPEAPGSWAGINANFDVLHFEINRIKYTQYSQEQAGGENEYHPETHPEAGLRQLI